MRGFVKKALAFLALAAVLVIAGSAATAATEMVPIVVDGLTIMDRAAVIDGVPYLPLSVLDVARDKPISYDEAKKKVFIGVPVIGYKPVLEVVMGEPQCRELVEGLRLAYRSSVAVPEKLDYYSCVILNNENAVSPKIADWLKKYVADGGGVVMVRAIPLLLAGGNPQNIKGMPTLQSIADWFGSTRIASIQLDGKGFGVPVSLFTSTNHVLGTPFERETVLFKYQGDKDYAMVDGGDEFCEFVAGWHSERNNIDTWYTAAVYHPYGKGRVYWQSVVDDPNYPKLKELFRAGVLRVVTGRNLPGR